MRNIYSIRLQNNIFLHIVFLKYVDTTGSSKSSKMSNINSDDSGNVWQKKANRIQDRAILEMSDDGMCMSMHQPWASLLVKGIKR